jgi:hypothetical protein
VADVGPDGLADWLRAWPTGPDIRRAVELVIAGGWLIDDRFVRACVVPVDGRDRVAIIDWAAMASFARTVASVDQAQACELWAIHAVAARSWRGFGP